MLINNPKINFLFLLLHVFIIQIGYGQDKAINQVEVKASPRPDRILLTWQTNPATSQTITWRTDNTVKTPQAEIAEADASPLFVHYAQSFVAKTEYVKTETGSAAYHKVNFSELKPDKLYAYRVGDGVYWSEWFQFRTAKTKPAPFSFIYLGDAQTNLFSLWSRTIRAAYAAAPQASFMVHAGDLVNEAESDAEWQEWFAAGGFIYASIPQFFTPGNHEYTRTAGVPHITKFWRPQINLPDNGPIGKEDMVYFQDFQGMRIISLNPYWGVTGQIAWLEKILKVNPNKWTVVLFHYPVYSAARMQDHKGMIRHWQPLFDKYKVDLVLQGHDHTYARGTSLEANKSKTALVGPVYVISVSGPKMYDIKKTNWQTRSAENTQLYQIISVDSDKINYKSFTVTGELYDAFELTKMPDGTKKLTEMKPDIKEERRFNNTLSIPKK